MFSGLLKAFEINQILPVISLVFFFLFFTAVLIWTLKIDKKIIQETEILPLDEGSDIINNGEDNHAR